MKNLIENESVSFYHIVCSLIIPSQVKLIRYSFNRQAFNWRSPAGKPSQLMLRLQQSALCFGLPACRTKTNMASSADVHVRICAQEIIKYDLEIKALIQVRTQNAQFVCWFVFFSFCRCRFCSEAREGITRRRVKRLTLAAHSCEQLKDPVRNRKSSLHYCNDNNDFIFISFSHC